MAVQGGSYDPNEVTLGDGLGYQLRISYETPGGRLVARTGYEDRFTDYAELDAYDVAALREFLNRWES
jgi:hypothetical protein